jgi:hypothetical protein
MKDRNQSPLGNSAADASKASQPGMKNSVMDFAPLNASTDPLNLSMNFKGNLEDAANYYYKEANKLYIANLVLNNQVSLSFNLAENGDGGEEPAGTQAR